MKYDTVVIGAGITGMTCAYQLTRAKKNILVLESRDRVGGQMHTVKVGDFTFEEGPSTSVVKYPEVAELFEQLGDSCQLEVACESSKRRLIWKGDRFHELPSGLVSAIRTPLFNWCDKIRILMEPWRKKGNNPNESVGELAQRRLGKSYVDYAVDPFMSGVYAGDPYKLPTRLALPKLYNLEQEYGSFIRGSIAKAKLPKTERDKKASKKLFSVKGGFVQLITALEKAIGSEHIITSASGVRVMPSGKDWSIAYSVNGEQHTIEAGQVVTTCGAYALPEVLPFIDSDKMADISNLFYAPVVQVGVGLADCGGNVWKAFGALVPSKEKKDVLGILFPSACFVGRSPEAGASMSFFMGGVRHQDMLQYSDEELTRIVSGHLADMLGYPAGKKPDAIRIFRHQHAIPQYEVSSDARFKAIDDVQRQYPTLRIAGNLRGGIGMGDRIKQAFDEASYLVNLPVE